MTREQIEQIKQMFGIDLTDKKLTPEKEKAYLDALEQRKKELYKKRLESEL